MKTLEIQVPEEVAFKLEKAASDRGVSIAQFVELSVEEKLAREEEFNRAAETVLAKNVELYKRLA